MMRLCASLMIAVFLAACGADGMPTKPEPKEKPEATEEITTEDATQAVETVKEEVAEDDTAAPVPAE